MEKIKELCKKYEEIIAYLIVGVLTTIVSWAAKFIANAVFFDNTMYPTPLENGVLSTINWVTGVIFAYFTNRKFVFKTQEPMRKDAPKFVLSRVSTWILDVVVMQVLTAVKIDLVVATLISAVLVTVANYFLSKFFVFNKGADSTKSGSKKADGKKTGDKKADDAKTGNTETGNLKILVQKDIVQEKSESENE